MSQKKKKKTILFPRKLLEIVLYPKRNNMRWRKKSALDQERGEGHARKSVEGDALGRG